MINEIEIKLIKRKTFSKILVAIHESRTSVDTAVDYAIKIAQDYGRPELESR